MNHEFESIFENFESVSEIEELENVNGGLILAYAIGAGSNKAITNLIKKFFVLPK